MEQLKNTIAEIFDEINWKYKLHHFEDSGKATLL